jgi:hypothetical protein
MRRMIVAIALLVCACSRSEQAEPGPVYTPAVANLLTALSKDCAFTRADGVETWTCTGRQTNLTVVLGREDHVRSVEFVIVASSAFETAEMLKPVLPSVASPTLIDYIAKRINRGMAMPEEEIEGVMVYVKNAYPKYNLVMRWFPGPAAE